jgi:hypothetical protein
VKVKNSDSPMRLAAIGHHRYADGLYSPEVGDLPARGRVQDERLYSRQPARSGAPRQPANGTGNGRNGNGGSNGNGGVQSASRTPTKPPAKSTAKTTKGR